MKDDKILNPLSRRHFIQGAGAVLAGAALSFPAIGKSRQLTIISNRGNVEQKLVIERLAREFGKMAGVNVVVNNMDHEAHKTAIRNYLVASPPDICFWFSGSRMRTFVERGLFADLSDLVEQQNYRQALGGTIGSVTINDRQYGLPTGGILWGMFYRQDTFNEHNLTVPKTFDDFFLLADQSKKAGITPISMGTKNMWPAAGWFDHMNLRINGLDHHMALMNGKIPYTDGSLKEVFDLWEQLINADLFTPNATSYAWDPAAAQLVQKKAAMMDLGNFIKYSFPKEDLDQLKFAPFPTIKSDMPQYEDFSVDSIHVPSGAPNIELAKEFLSYFYQPENLAAYLEPEGNLPARNDCPPSNDAIVNMIAREMKSVQGTAQYYDRDSHPDLAREGLKGFQEFMVRPQYRDNILLKIERARQRIYG
ncbi:ABC transporter substrate-binding protein [Marinomonas foliarum]|uniref:Extracellular solute-binding protein n=1 Tax=Marinomonas foliarum TaxID=491950 RepID=A0ABX7IL93_9GAMM|nr:extracellular solute-binding protein [Marinomonas foliarum]QRV22403.1 extracellular solute-binding protein [Marinomonas foliarum]